MSARAKDKRQACAGAGGTRHLPIPFVLHVFSASASSIPLCIEVGIPSASGAFAPRKPTYVALVAIHSFQHEHVARVCCSRTFGGVFKSAVGHRTQQFWLEQEVFESAAVYPGVSRGFHATARTVFSRGFVRLIGVGVRQIFFVVDQIFFGFHGRCGGVFLLRCHGDVRGRETMCAPIDQSTTSTSLRSPHPSTRMWWRYPNQKTDVADPEGRLPGRGKGRIFSGGGAVVAKERNARSSWGMQAW